MGLMETRDYAKSRANQYDVSAFAPGSPESLRSGKITSNAGTSARGLDITMPYSYADTHISYQNMRALLPAHHPKDICQREAAVQEVYNLLIQDATSALVLTGMQKVGKSTLASLVWEYTEEQRHHGRGPFKGEALWLEVKTAVSLSDLFATLLELFGHPPSKNHTFSEQNLLFELVHLLQNSTPRLIVLDQFHRWQEDQTGKIRAEQTNVAEWLDSINSHPCSSRLILTSRLRPQWSHINRYSCIQEIPVYGLSIHEGTSLLRLWGVQGNDEELIQAVKRCQGHAQALALLEQLLREKAVKLSTLLYDPEYMQLWFEDVEHNLFNHFYVHQLDPGQRDLLCTLAAYREAVPLVAIQSPSTKKLLPAILNGLQTRSLLLVHSSNERRYELHPLIAEYIRRHVVYERADAHTDDALRHIHSQAAQYYLNHFNRLGQDKQERLSIGDIHDLIEATWHYCRAGQFQDAYALIVQEQIFTDLHRWGHNTVLLELYRELLHWQPGDEQEAEINNQIGEIYLNLGQRSEARAFFEHAAALFKKHDVREGEARALNNLGIIYRSYEQLEQAATYYRKALATCEESATEISEKGAILHNVGTVYQHLGQKEESPPARQEYFLQALQYYTQALAAHRALYNQEEEGKTLNALGELYSNLEQNETAYQYHQQALELFLELSDRRNEGITYSYLGIYSRKIGAYQDALTYYSQALKIYQEIGDRWEEITVLRNIGRLLAWSRRYDVALACFWQARETADIIQATPKQEGVPSWIYHAMGEKHFAQVWSEVETNAPQILEQAVRVRFMEEKKSPIIEPHNQSIVSTQKNNASVEGKETFNVPQHYPPTFFEKGSMRPMIRVLFLAANPLDTDRLLLEKEFRAITERIRASKFRTNFELHSALAVRQDDLLRELNYHRPHIAHFSGHGSQTGSLQFYGEGDSSLSEPIEAWQLKEIFHAWRGDLRLVILNACYSETQARQIVEEIDCVIGMNDEIFNSSAIIFSDALYDAIGSGCSIATAFEQAKTKLLISKMHSEQIPVLLTRSGVDANQINLANLAAKTQAENVITPQTQARESQLTHANPIPSIPSGGKQPLPIYCSYAKEDHKFYLTLKNHCVLMESEGSIHLWGYQDLQGGDITQETILQQLHAARIILLFISPNFFKSDRQLELDLAQTLQKEHKTKIIPIKLRNTTAWEKSPFARFFSLPRNGKPVVLWQDRDEAFYDITQDIQKVVEDVNAGQS